MEPTVLLCATVTRKGDTMNKLLILTALASAVALSAGAASAANTAIILWNGANPGDAETATGNNSADLFSTNLDGITITASTVNLEANPDGMTEGNIQITNTSNVAQTLHIIAGVNGFDNPTKGFNLSATILASIGQSTLFGSFYSNADNHLNGTALGVSAGSLDLGDFNSGLLSGPFSYSFNSSALDAISGPYGLTESLTLNLAAGASIGVQSISMDATGAAPELSTWAMATIGFGLVGIVGLRSRKGERSLAV